MTITKANLSMQINLWTLGQNSPSLLENGVKVNIVSKDGYNEFYFLAPNISCNGALGVAEKLLSREASVMQRDIKYGNTAFFSLCVEAFKTRSENIMMFIEKCFEKVTDVDEKNNKGFSIRMLINERGNEKLKRLLEEKYE